MRIILIIFWFFRKRIYTVFVISLINFRERTESISYLLNKKYMKKEIPTINAMNHLIATYTVMSQNARFCHWNVVGPHFEDDHEFFGDLYDELSESVDLFAERVRALREFPISRLSDILKETKVTEYELPMTARNMQKNMLKDYESLSMKMAELAELTGDDVVTQDIIVGEKRQIDKRAWMMRAMLGE